MSSAGRWSTVFYQVRNQLNHLPGNFCANAKAPKPLVTVMDCARLMTELLRKLRDTRYQTTQMGWTFFKHPMLCHRLLASVPHRNDAVTHARGALWPSTQRRNGHTFPHGNISVLQAPFWCFLCNILRNRLFLWALIHNHHNHQD